MLSCFPDVLPFRIHVISVIRLVFFGPMTYSKKAVLYERNVYIYSFTSNGISIMGLFNEIYRVSTVNIHEIIQV